MAFPRPGGGGGSIDTIQNTDGTVTVVDGAGPTTTVSVASGKFLPLAGGTMSGHIDMGGGRIVDAAAAINPTDVPIFSQVSGGGSSLGIAQLVLNTSSPVYGELGQEVALPFDPVNFLPSSGQELVVTAPLVSVAPAQVVLTFVSASVSGIDTTNDEFNVGAQIAVGNLDGSETMLLTGTVQTTGGGPDDTATLDSTGMSVSTQTGTDLAYDPSTGLVTSVAGGTYGHVDQATGSWE